MVFKRVKGVEGVGEVSSLSFHSGREGGRASVAPSVKAPPVRECGVKDVVFAGWGGEGVGGGFRDEG